MMSIRTVKQVTQGEITSDGAGVKLTRLIGTDALPDLDPFLLLDFFESDQSSDYIGGFPPHPHRGFETVTYMLQGKMRHQDNHGNEGVIEPGGVQWMTAGKGIVHSEMPEQEEGMLSGLQLWVNLPAAHKMTEPAYQEHPHSNFEIAQSEATTIKVIAGETDQGKRGIIHNDFVHPLYLDVNLKAGYSFRQTVPDSHNAFIYVLDGQIQVGEPTASQLNPNDLAVLSHGNNVEASTQIESRFILAAAQPLHEPIARGGPFVMNTPQEVQQAFRDYREGRF